MQEGASKTRAWVVLMAIAAALGLFQLMQQSRTWTADSRAEQVGRELLRADTPEVAAALAKDLGGLEEAGIRPLVTALTSQEPMIAQAAADEISHNLAAWRVLPGRTSAARVAALVHEVAAQWEEIAPEQQLRARQWAEAVLLWPRKSKAVDAGRIVADCQIILEGPLPDENLVAERMARADLRKSSPAPQEPEIALPELPAASSADSLDNVGQLPSQPHVKEPLSSKPLLEEPPILNPREPRGIFVPRAGRIEDAVKPEEPKTLPAPLPSPPEIKASQEITAVPDFELMQDLHSADAAASQAAIDELARRGYKPVHLVVARRLTDPDPAVRRKLVESLSRVPGIDPRPWLLRLCEDEDDGVRSAARSILKTSQDPELLNKLR